MSHSQFRCTILILTHAWLNLWDKHMTTGRINQITTFARHKAPQRKRFTQIAKFCWLLCESLAPEGSSMIQAIFFTICASWNAFSDRVIGTGCWRTSGKWAPLCRTKHVQRFTTEYVCSLLFIFIAYHTVEVLIQHFSWSRVPVKALFQGRTLAPKNSIL